MTKGWLDNVDQPLYFFDFSIDCAHFYVNVL
jgi:hypothetical protein